MWGNTSIKWCPDRNQTNSTIRRRQKARASSCHLFPYEWFGGRFHFIQLPVSGVCRKCASGCYSPGIDHSMPQQVYTEHGAAWRPNANRYEMPAHGYLQYWKILSEKTIV